MLDWPGDELVPAVVTAHRIAQRERDVDHASGQLFRRARGTTGFIVWLHSARSQGGSNSGLDTSDFLGRSCERRTTVIRIADVHIARCAGKQMHMEVRIGVAVDLVVHLHRRHQRRDSLATAMQSSQNRT